MKKGLLIIFILCLLMPQAYATEYDRLTVNTSYKTTVIEDGLCYYDGQSYLPLVSVSESLGAVVFENVSAGGYYIISRDGDVITHSVNDSFYLMNGTIRYNSCPSIYTDLHGMLVPIEMIEGMFFTVVSYDRSGAYINREMYTNYYSEIVSRLMKACLRDNFYPENFVRYYSYSCKNPQLDAGTVINNVNIGLDKKYFDDAVVVSTPDTREVLVNKLSRLPENYSAKNLSVVDRLYVKGSGRIHQLDTEAYYKYVDMYDAAVKDGLQLKIVSSYRTEAYQRNLYNSYLRNYGFAYAEQYSAHPGYSEHQTGLAVDINSLYTTFENSREYAWLKAHAHEFGYIERYQKGKEYITGYSYEPWHYRYVGIDAAKIIHEQGITYEEYFASYIYSSDYSLDKDRAWANVLQHFHK